MQILFLRFLRLHLQYTISWLYIKMRERYRSTSPTATTTESTSSTITRGENPAPVSSENRTWGGSTHHNHSEPRIRTRCSHYYSILLLSSVVAAIAVTCYGRIIVSYFQHNKNVYRYDRNIQNDDDINHTSSSMTEPTSIKIVTMNIAQLVPSGKAPDSWVANPQLALDYLRQTLLGTNPDIIALQECPSSLWVDTFLVDYQQYYYPTSSIPQTTASHAGYVALWVRKDWAAHVDAVSSAVHLPAVAARLSFTSAAAGSRRLEIWIASMHLEPFQQGSFTRKDQLEELLQLASHQTQEEVVVILAGDTNMRDEEDRVVEDSLKLVDAWKAAGADPHTRFSWDTTATIANGNHNQTAGGPNLSSGRNTGANQRRYDRLYSRHFTATPDETDRDGEIRVTVPSFRLIANEPIGQSTEHFLSDHFGLAAEIRIEWL
jgi:endonuclease/exonuclease/phosphatase family metal-dependent hydrolase